MGSKNNSTPEELKDWIRRRVAAVLEVCSAFQILIDSGVDTVPDDSTPTQIACMFHGADAKPSARYYPRSGRKSDYVRCFKCRENWDGINLYAKFRGLRFMDALADLERKYRIMVPRRPDGPPITEPADRKSDYVSDKWYDIPRVLLLLEQKLLRVREKMGMVDFVKYCRLLDAIEYDFNKTGKPTDEMVSVLKKAMARIDEMTAMNQMLLNENDSAN